MVAGGSLRLSEAVHDETQHFAEELAVIRRPLAVPMRVFERLEGGRARDGARRPSGLPVEALVDVGILLLAIERLKHGVAVVVALDDEERRVVPAAHISGDARELPSGELPVDGRDVLSGPALVDDCGAGIAADALGRVNGEDVFATPDGLGPDLERPLGRRLTDHLGNERWSRLRQQRPCDGDVEERAPRDEEARLRIRRVLLVRELGTRVVLFAVGAAAERTVGRMPSPSLDEARR